MTIMQQMKCLKDKGYNDHCLWNIDQVKVLCKIKDCREVFGRVDLMIEPYGGKGMKWVAESSCSPVEFNPDQIG